MKLAILLALAFTTSACVIEDDGGGGDPWGDEASGGGGGSSSTYSNHVKLECNGSVLIDRTFTSRSECEAFKESNDFYCSGILMPYSC